MENWVDVIPHRAEVLLEGFEIFKDYLVLEEREKGCYKLRLLMKKLRNLIIFLSLILLIQLTLGSTWNLTLKFSDMVTLLTQPGSTYEYNMKDKTTKLLKQQEVLGGKFFPKIIFLKESGQIPEMENKNPYFSCLP
jgi:oligopeptidase B